MVWAANTNPRGNRTPARPATAMVMTTGSAISPRNALGNPNTEACQEAPTVPQLMAVLMLQDRSAWGSLARVTASTERTKDARRLQQVSHWQRR